MSEPSFLRADTCKYFVGVQHEYCEAGVLLRSVRDSSGTGPYRWPCLPPMKAGQTCATSCSKRAYPTADEIAASAQEVSDLIKRMEKPPVEAPPSHDYLSAGDNPYASGDRAYHGCSLCGLPRSRHR